MTDADQHTLTSLQEEFSAMRERLTLLEGNQEFFKETVLTQIASATEGERAIGFKLDRLTQALAEVPKEITGQLNSCRNDVQSYMDTVYAKKTEVVTATSLRNTLLLVAALVTVLGAGINWLLEETITRHQLELEVERGIHSQSYEPKSGVWHESGQRACGLPTICI